MTVESLIKILKLYDPATPVVIRGEVSEGTWDDCVPLFTFKERKSGDVVEIS